MLMHEQNFTTTLFVTHLQSRYHSKLCFVSCDKKRVSAFKFCHFQSQKSPNDVAVDDNLSSALLLAIAWNKHEWTSEGMLKQNNSLTSFQLCKDIKVTAWKQKHKNNYRGPFF